MICMKTDTLPSTRQTLRPDRLSATARPARSTRRKILRELGAKEVPKGPSYLYRYSTVDFSFHWFKNSLFLSLAIQQLFIYHVQWNSNSYFENDNAKLKGYLWTVVSFKYASVLWNSTVLLLPSLHKASSGYQLVLTAEYFEYIQE